jgi:hypothetical protein
MQLIFLIKKLSIKSLPTLCLVSIYSLLGGFEIEKITFFIRICKESNRRVFIKIKLIINYKVKLLEYANNFHLSVFKFIFLS